MADDDDEVQRAILASLHLDSGGTGPATHPDIAGPSSHVDPDTSALPPFECPMCTVQNAAGRVCCSCCDAPHPERQAALLGGHRGVGGPNAVAGGATSGGGAAAAAATAAATPSFALAVRMMPLLLLLLIAFSPTYT